MFDIVINGAYIVDGTNTEPFLGSIGIVGDKIEKISKDNLEGKRVIDGKDRILAPGFIDMHSHSDSSFIVENNCESKLFQGITSEFIGSCGISLIPNNDSIKNQLKDYCKSLCVTSDKISLDFSNLKEYAKIINEKGAAINCIPQIGHGTIRMCVMGYDNKIASKKELEDMKKLLRMEMENGAFGMSLGLIYPPGIFSNTEELCELATVLKEYDGVLTAHIRGESYNVFNAVEEIISIARETGVKINISHLKLIGRSQWKRGKELLNIINKARDSGVNISCDQYPYSASCTSLYPLIPKYAQAGGVNGFIQLIDTKWKEISDYIEKEVYNRGGSGKIILSSAGEYFSKYEGKSLKSIANVLNIRVSEVVRDIFIKTKGSASVIYYCMNEDDIECIMKDMFVAIGSDGAALSFKKELYSGKPHPRGFGTFPKFIRRALDKELMPIQSIIYKTSALPARILGIKDRGIIKEGNIADLVLFNKDEIQYKGSYMDPFSKPEGIDYVFVSGKVVLENGVQTGAKLGKVLLKGK
ncbi:N-acyl-D-amino-acid deacylase family protein [Clostridium rectalis]|uniref:N-acyl-D-amino-acid deacylase family protein n=1 Tax=Clostridium rectalis TaxID=2040295 RepID=UPI000F63C411|nr:D-aminoacylase [Clostridium rectalis]